MGLYSSIKNRVDRAVDEAEDRVQGATGVDFGGSGGGNNADDVTDTNEDTSQGVTDNPKKAAKEAASGAKQAAEKAVDKAQDAVENRSNSTESPENSGGDEYENVDDFQDSGTSEGSKGSALESFKRTLPGNNQNKKTAPELPQGFINEKDAKDTDIVSRRPGETGFFETGVERQLSYGFNQQQAEQIRETGGRKRAQRYLKATQRYRQGQERLENLTDRIESFDPEATYIVDRNGEAPGGKAEVSGTAVLQDFRKDREELKKDLGQIAENQGQRLENITPSQNQQETTLRNLIRENPGVASLSIQLENARSGGAGNLDSVMNRIQQNEQVSMQNIRKYKALSNEFSYGKLNVIKGEALSKSLSSDVAEAFDASNPVVNALTRGVTISGSVLDELGETVTSPDTERSAEAGFRNDQTRTDFKNTGFQPPETDSKTLNTDLNVDTGDSPETGSLQDALSYSEERADNLADSFGQGVGGLAATPLQVVRRTGQVQQLASGQLSPGEAGSATVAAGATAVAAAKKNPVKTGVTLLPGLVTGSALSKASRLGKTPDIDSELKATVNRLTEKADGDSALGEGFAQVKTTVKRPLVQRALGKGRYKEFGTQINTPGIQAFDRSGNLYGRAVTRTEGGREVNTESFVASSLRKSPDEVEGRVGEASTIGTKLEIEGGDTEFIESDSTVAGKIEGQDYVEYYRQSAQRDSVADLDLSRSRTRIYRDQEGNSGKGSGVSAGKESGDGGVTAGSGGGRVELEQSRESSGNRFEVTPGGLNQDSAEALADYSVRNSGQLPESNTEGNTAGMAASAQAQTQERQGQQTARDTGMTVSTVDTSYSPGTKIQKTGGGTVLNESAKRENQRFKKDAEIGISTDTGVVEDARPGVAASPDTSTGQKLLQGQGEKLLPRNSERNRLETVPETENKFSTLLIEKPVFKQLQEESQKTLLQSIQTPATSAPTGGRPRKWDLPEFGNKESAPSKVTTPRRKRQSFRYGGLKTDWFSANLVEQVTNEEAVYNPDAKPRNKLFGLKTVQERKGKVEQPKAADLDIDLL